jgi:6-pyruvoyltetrahydropterin/6-carboxytetrahydropterin synthase
VADPSGPPLPPRATLVVAKEALGFSAAHFSILDTGSEPIHGHNYRVALRATGHVGERGTVLDFAALKAAVRAACAELDHRMLVPASCPQLTVALRATEVEVTEGERRFVFPRAEVALLPAVNTTCECLAAYLLGAVRSRLGDAPVRLEVTVEETPGQSATVAEDG